MDWWGIVTEIPLGWALCDGTQGTPDLRDKFVYGAGLGQAVGNVGGSDPHTHGFTGDGHFHDLAGGAGTLPAVPNFDIAAASTPATGTTDSGSNMPTYYALAKVMRL